MPAESQELRKAGLKVTLPRVKILQILESSEVRHMSAEDVYKSLLDAGDDVGLATVYRVLTQFESAGLVERHNFDVVTAKDGVDALAQLEDVQPDVMLLDIEMPRMDGFELATHMRNEQSYSAIPIIMITMYPAVVL